MEKVISLVLQAIAILKTKGLAKEAETLTEFCIDRGFKEESVKACLANGCTDLGAVKVMFERQKLVETDVEVEAETETKTAKGRSKKAD